MTDYDMSYHAQQTDKINEKIQTLFSSMPKYIPAFMNAKNDKWEPRTKLAYLQDLSIFFEYLVQKNPYIKTYTDVSYEILDALNADDIADYGVWLDSYKINGKKHRNGPSGKRRKYAALSSFYNYLVRTEKCKRNPVMLIDKPKLHDNDILALSDAETKKFLHTVEYGSEKQSNRAKTAHEISSLRDTALITLLLSTGMRVSECVGINLDDISFVDHRIRIIRKGGSQKYIYMSDEAENAISDYIKYGRDQYKPTERDENALFLSRMHTRITPRAVEMLVKKYADLSLGAGSGVTPHKMRSTFATNLLAETENIALVAAALNHKSPDTTYKRYSKLNDAAVKKAIRKE